MFQSSSFDRLVEVLAPYHPIYADFTIVALDDRSRDGIHYFLHKKLGGLMPQIVPFEQYKRERFEGSCGLVVIEEEEAFVRFHLFCRSKDRTKRPEESEQLFSFLRLLSRFSVSQEELQTLDRLTPEQGRKIEDIFSLLYEFREFLKKEHRSYLPFEEEFFRSLIPREKDLFVGLPLLTPVHEAFLAKVPKEKLFVPEASFGPRFPLEEPEYETAYHLVAKYDLPARRLPARSTEKERLPPLNLSFSEVQDRSSLAALITEEVEQFLKTREPMDQMAILLLDEELSFYLWRLLFASKEETVNFSPWLPFRHFGVAHRLSAAVSSGENLTDLKGILAKEIRTKWEGLDLAEQAAFEAAITLCEELSQWQKEIDQDEEWKPLAQFLIQSKKLHLPGSREAPIQVLGLGETGSVSFAQGLILPMDRDIFPHKPFRGPYLNVIHTPRIYRAQFEANDLLLRQFLSLCKKAHIAARFDKTNGFAPSPHFMFLATEFDANLQECYQKPNKFTVSSTIPAFPASEEIQQFLRSFQWSFHSLQLFFSCPYHFLLKYKERLDPPSVLEEGEEAIQLHIGNVLHEWAATLHRQPPALENWRKRFEEVWKERVGDDHSPGEEYFSLQGIYKPIILSYLEDIAHYEREQGKLLLFADDGVRREQWIHATFGNGAFQLRGRLDRIQLYEGKMLILDLKYRAADKVKPPPKGTSRGLESYLQEKETLHEAHQLIVYAYLLKVKDSISPNDLSAAFYALKEIDPEERVVFLPQEDIGNLDTHMEQIARTLDARIAQKEFLPNYKSEQCRFCSYQPLCGHPDGLKGGDGW
ncbi:MAG: PD-(D/E)XK nuclease family protein [Spirochaetes bacterium]|nr:PD-(D/E)XK nuclease family protein [Spirochaetota bacterium]